MRIACDVARLDSSLEASPLCRLAPPPSPASLSRTQVSVPVVVRPSVFSFRENDDEEKGTRVSRCAMIYARTIRRVSYGGHRSVEPATSRSILLGNVLQLQI